MTLEEILSENNTRNKEVYTFFDPITGEGAVGDRFKLTLTDHFPDTLYIPNTLKKNAFIKMLGKAGSIDGFLEELIKRGIADRYDKDSDRDKVIQQFVRLRAKHDFCYWAISFAFIKNKEGGDDMPFRLNRPQRKLVTRLEANRLASKPIRLILLKARQWGGSTCIQVYMAWLQLMHMKGWNSLVVSHVMQSTAEVRGMFTKLMAKYPLWLLYEDSDYNEKDKKLMPFEGSQSIDLIPQRNCKIKVGTAESPDSARGGDSAMVHCTEVAFWKKTENKTPEMIIRSACSGVLYAPYTMEVFETTANGTGNFFYDEWARAKDGKSDKEPLFISWHDIELYAIPIEDLPTFAKKLLSNKDDNELVSHGKYNWWLWTKGATLEAINWYEHKRKGYDDHADMAAEYPSDDIEAFKHSGRKVFSIYDIEKLRIGCKPPTHIGELRGDETTGKAALTNIRFNKSDKGLLHIWEDPDTEMRISNRYVVSVDIGGRSDKSDYSVICVIDRYWLMYGDKPVVVAQWKGHIRHDLLAWKAAQIATYYNNALLVIESNTLETKNRDTDGDHTVYILEEIAQEYRNMYARSGGAESVKEGSPIKWGFHTNASTKVAIIDNLITILEESKYVERDCEALDELATYERKQNGSLGAISGKHDDMLITRAIGLYVSGYKMDQPREVKEENKLTKRNVGALSTI